MNRRVRIAPPWLVLVSHPTGIRKDLLLVRAFRWGGDMGTKPAGAASKSLVAPPVPVGYTPHYLGFRPKEPVHGNGKRQDVNRYSTSLIRRWSVAALALCALLSAPLASTAQTAEKKVKDQAEYELFNVIAVVKRLTDLYRERLGINNLQIINSSGREAQQDVFHVHFHIVPRREDDGQNIVWKTYPALREKFDEMIERIKR